MMNKQILIGLFFAAPALIVADNTQAIELAPQMSNENGVKLTASLENTSGDKKTWDFSLALETHVHALSENLEQVSVLVADGRQYQPLAWEGSPPGGHHRKGILRFKAVAPLPGAVELRIQLSGEAAPRRFNWRLKQ